MWARGLWREGGGDGQREEAGGPQSTTPGGSQQTPQKHPETLLAAVRALLGFPTQLTPARACQRTRASSPLPPEAPGLRTAPWDPTVRRR